MASSALSLQIGEIVVYGSEGFARIDGTSEREVLGRTVTVLDLYVIDSSMTVSVPLERAQERGLRPVATFEEAESALETISTAGTGRQMPWNRDGRMLKERFAEGNIDATVDVLCSLIDAESLKRLNDGQKNLLDKARKAFCREIAASLEVEREVTDARLDAAIERRRLTPVVVVVDE